MIKHSLLYMLAEVINKAIPFLLLPLLTKYLTPYDYGVIASFSAFVGFVYLFINMSMHGVINVNFFKMDHMQLNRYLFNALGVLTAASLLAVMVVFVLQGPLSSSLLLDAEWLYLGVVVALSKVVTIIHLTLWIAEKKPKEYGLYQIMQTLLSTAMAVILVVGYRYDWRGQVIAVAIASIVFALVSLSFFFRRGALHGRYAAEDVKDLLQFGVPMIPHQLSGWLISSGDRLLLIAMIGASATGLFSVGYQVGMVMGVLVTAFQKVWNPYIYEKLSKPISQEMKLRIVKWTYGYFALLVLLVVFLDQIAYYIFSYWIDTNFTDAYRYVVYILIMYAFNGMYFMVVGYLFYFKKTKVLATITFTNALLHVGLSYLLIRIYGAIGVAYSGIISYAIMFVAVWIYSHRIYPMPWGLGLLGRR
jgi:O-antigen/teichoic acid export membrane protein